MQKKARTYSGTKNPTASRRELRNREIARRAAAEGIVLLKNECHLLPLESGRRLALFGGGAVNTIKGGTGSGDVNERENVTIWQGLQAAGYKITSEIWLEDYKYTYEEARERWKNQILKESKGLNPTQFFSVYASHPFQIPSGRQITVEDCEEGGTDTAIFVISRIAGEAADRYEREGDYYLTREERKNLEVVCTHFAHVILVINTGGQIDISFARKDERIQAVIYMSQAGMEGGNAVADIIRGKVTPSGKLTDTWAESYQDYPASASFSHNNGNVEKEYYKEGIYVGYRYFQSFGITPAYPFGYGLSYTSFAVLPCAEPVEVDQEKQRIFVSVMVKNTGNKFSGREVAQVYISCPQDGQPKEFRRLCGFAKTRLLAPGEEQKLTISFPVKGIASFHEEKAAWIVERGLYGIWTGNSSEDLVLAGAVQTEGGVVEKTAHICKIQEPLEEIIRPSAEAGEFQDSWHRLLKEQNLAVKALAVREGNAAQNHTQSPAESFTESPTGNPAESPTGSPVESPTGSPAGNPAEKAAAVLAEKLTEEELTAMVMGAIEKGQSQAAENALGSAGIMVPGAAGETSSILEEAYGIPGVSMADGPAGLRLAQKYQVSEADGRIYAQGLFDALEGGLFAKKQEHDRAVTYYQYATAIPVGTLLAQSFDTQLLEEVGRAVAEEMEEFHISWWLAPGMNIHRDPLCGRNFEYYSEDPVVSGVMAAALTRGVQSAKGVGTTIKHFACNNQEDNRKGSDSIISERALREIYLRGFEIAVKTAQPMAIMTSYNLVNGIHTANSFDLCTTAVRKEWGFQGIIMTDWTTTSPGSGSIPHLCIKAGNDLIMPGSSTDAEDIRGALAEGRLGREELKACVKRLLTLIYQSGCFEEAVSYASYFEGMEEYLQNEME